jgi:ABC-type transporter Mla MlaB component
VWPADQLSIEVRQDRRRLMLVLHGELDHVTALAVWMSVELALADGWDEVIVD